MKMNKIWAALFGVHHSGGECRQGKEGRNHH